MTLQTVAGDLSCVDHPFSVGGLALGLRTTVMRLPSGAVVLHSPGPLDDAQTAAIAALGPVRAILAPNLLHHLFILDARRRFPDAKLIAPATMAKKRPDLTLDFALSPDAAAPSLLEGTLTPIFVRGMPKLDEIAWIHAPSRTLILGDLAFNLRPPKPWLTRAVMALNGGFDRFGPTRVARLLTRDRRLVRASIDAILAHDFDRVIVTHGNILANDGKNQLRQGWSWLQ